MNIFVLDTNPTIAAKQHCNKHVVKMITESVQMLSTVHRLNGNEVGYRKTHSNHPCTKWVAQSRQNYQWLVELTLALHDEWRYRYNHPPKHMHKSVEVMLNLPPPDFLPNKGLTPFAQAMPEQYKSDNAVKSYRAYYLGEKLNILTYTKREVPDWLV